MNNKTRPALLASGISLIILSIIVLGFSLWEAFGGSSGRFRVIEVPGFHQLDLKEGGLYAGVYQHRSNQPMPVKALSQIQVRIMYKPTYDEIPVVTNTAGVTFNRLGIQGMPLFNFAIQEPGTYTLSADYAGDAKGPIIPVTIMAQSAANAKQTLIVGGAFFALFLILGILILTRLNKWAPKKPA